MWHRPRLDALTCLHWLQYSVAQPEPVAVRIRPSQDLFWKPPGTAIFDCRSLASPVWRARGYLMWELLWQMQSISLARLLTHADMRLWLGLFTTTRETCEWLQLQSSNCINIALPRSALRFTCNVHWGCLAKGLQLNCTVITNRTLLQPQDKTGDKAVKVHLPLTTAEGRALRKFAVLCKCACFVVWFSFYMLVFVSDWVVKKKLILLPLATAKLVVTMRAFFSWMSWKKRNEMLDVKKKRKYYKKCDISTAKFVFIWKIKKI